MTQEKKQEETKTIGELTPQELQEEINQEIEFMNKHLCLSSWDIRDREEAERNLKRFEERITEIKKEIEEKIKPYKEYIKEEKKKIKTIEKKEEFYKEHKESKKQYIKALKDIKERKEKEIKEEAKK